MTDSKVALITGGNRGIGLEVARQLGREGVIVVIGARDPRRGEAAASQLVDEGIRAHFVPLDVTSAADVAALPAYFVERYGRLDILVNNAGVALWGARTADDFRRTFEVNVFGVVAVTEALLPLLLESPAGRVVNHSSILGSLTSVQAAPEAFSSFIEPSYTASKAALNALTVAWAHQRRNTNLKINAAHPGWVKTELGGESAPLEVADGARTAVRLALLGPDGPTGKLFHLNDLLPW